MKIYTFNDRLFWLAARQGKITGTRASDVTPKVRGGGKKVGFYELIAERLGVPDEVEYPMERGARLEKEALDRFQKETGKQVDGSLVMWMNEDNESIAISPDGFIVPKKKNGLITEACEVKCLRSSLHIKAFLEKKIPEEYDEQALQYFVVNENLETLYFILYDPRFAMFKPPDGKDTKLDFFFITINKSEVKEKADLVRNQQLMTLKEVDEIVNQLSF